MPARMKFTVAFLVFIVAITLSGCHKAADPQNSVDLDKVMNTIYSCKLNQVEISHKAKVNEWLREARETGNEGQYFIYQDDTNRDVMYSYVYGKGFDHYKVSFTYSPDEPVIKGKIHVTGDHKSKTQTDDTFVQIKSINDPDLLFELSD